MTTNSYFIGPLMQETGICDWSECSVSSGKRCSKCNQRFYCGREHQNNDWKRHKIECSQLLTVQESHEFLREKLYTFPPDAQFKRNVQIRVTEKGKGLFAMEDIPAKEVIFREFALICTPEYLPTDCCHFCCKYGNVVECCSEERYCSVSCKELAKETFHKFVCPKENPNLQPFYDSLRTVEQNGRFPGEYWTLKLLGLCISNANPKKTLEHLLQRFFHIGKKMEHAFDYKKLIEVFHSSKDNIQRIFAEQLHEEDLEKLALIPYLNAQQILTYHQESKKFIPFGGGLFLFQSLINHSCQANVEVINTTVTKSVSVIAIRQISSGEEICSDYTLNTPKHRECLQNNWNISCTCK